jgi:DNA-binding NarL/FixJ family response regulator
VDVRQGSSRLRVLIAEDQYLAREGTRRLLEERDELEVVGVASDFDSVLAEARRLLQDVIVMDIKMPPSYSMEGIEAAHAIKEERPETGVVMLTQHDDEGYVWALLDRGVAGYGYLHKVRVGEVDQLVRAICEVAQAARCSIRGSSRRCCGSARASLARRWPGWRLAFSTCCA